MYPPTADKPDKDIESFYKDLENAHKSSRTHYYNGDFNAKVGEERVYDECTSSYGLGSIKINILYFWNIKKNPNSLP